VPKVDFEGAHLEGALLDGAQLQGASLAGAKLQSASLYQAQLQGASLKGGRLQGAELAHAQLQGASLEGARLQGAELALAQLQGASLMDANLQGASLKGAQLQGASLGGAQLQGASLEETQLQGALLQYAWLKATDLLGAYLWRTNKGGDVVKWEVRIKLDGQDLSDVPEKPASIKLSDAGNTWGPSGWSDKRYRDLLQAMQSVPLGRLRDEALERIRRLDCSNTDKTLASCDPDATAPDEAVTWRETLKAAAGGGDEAYTLVLVRTLKGLVCSGDDDAIDVLRGLGFQGRLRAAGAAASDLIDDLMSKDSKDCPVAASLTDADRAMLLQNKQAAIRAVSERTESVGGFSNQLVSD